MSEQNTGAALVTGAGKRIGRAIALELARLGYAVAVHFNHGAADAEDVAGQIRGAGGRACTLQADLGDADAPLALVGRAVTALGPLTCLVNNASVFELDTVHSATPDSWARHLDINLRAPFFLSQAFAAQLPAEASGNIVNMIDMRVWKLTPYFASYTVSKSGLWTLTQTLAMALAPRIRVNGIGPGPSLINERQTPDQFARQVAATPLGRGAGPDEICAGLRYILSAPSLTGQMLALDGGQHLPSPGLSDGVNLDE